MRILATEFTEGQYRYVQIERQGSLPIYSQAHTEAPVTRYEVIKIRVQPAHQWPSGQTSPEREVYPGASSWGTLGWPCFTLPEAHALMAGLSEEPLTQERTFVAPVPA